MQPYLQHHSSRPETSPADIIGDFITAMAEKFHRREEKRGETWRTMTVEQLRQRLLEEFVEWLEATLKGNVTDELEELVDIANQCMLLYHRLKEADNP